jgi:hypothetical protein
MLEAHLDSGLPFRRIRSVCVVALFFLSASHTKHNILADYLRHNLFPRNMATPNEEASLKTRIQQAKTFLQEHDNETIATTARTVSEPTISSNNEYFEEPCNCSRICKKLKQHEAPHPPAPHPAQKRLEKTGLFR